MIIDKSDLIDTLLVGLMMNTKKSHNKRFTQLAEQLTLEANEKS